MEEPDKFDPELGDENDPEYLEEMFEMLRDTRTKPEELVADAEIAEEYAECLKTHANSDPGHEA